MATFHQEFQKAFQWYRRWHDHPPHHYAHWAMFLIVSFLVSSFISSNIRNFYFENELKVQAQSLPRGEYQGMCPNGYIAIGGANASSADPAETPGWYCDDDQGEQGVTGMVYPTQALIVCDANNGVAFVADSWAWPCNSGRPPPNQGWDFSSGWPTKVNGTTLPFRQTVNCTGSGSQASFTLSNGNFTAGAWTQSPSVAGDLCVPGILVTPTPPVPTRFIFFIEPNPAQVGSTIIIGGQNLSPTIHLYDASGTRTQYTGTMNSAGTQVILIVPNIATGTYTLRVGPDTNDLSTALDLQIIGGVPSPTPIGTELPVIYSVNPIVAARGQTVSITGQFLSSSIQLVDINGMIINIIGWVNENGTLVTFTIPDSLNSGIYNVGITNANGSALATDILTVAEDETQVYAIGQVTPPDTTGFQNLLTSAYEYSLVFVGIAIFIMIIWGGLLWLTAGANPGNIATAKKIIFNAIIGGILLLAVYVILFTINPELVEVTLPLVGIVGPPPPPPGPPPPPPPGGGTTQDAALALLARIGQGAFYTSADCGNSYHALQNILDMAAGGMPAVCTSSNAGGTGAGNCNPCIAGGTSSNIYVWPAILEGLLNLANRGITFTVTSFTTGNHSANSSHYQGRAVDIRVNGNNIIWIEARGALDSYGGNAICEDLSDPDNDQRNSSGTIVTQDDPDCISPVLTHIHWGI